MAFEYKVKAHPTKYSGVEFRSRLEARWAALFDLLNWKWEYEPIDLEGWTPDFKLAAADWMFGRRTFYAEVKPYDNDRLFAKEHKFAAFPEKILLGLNPRVATVCVQFPDGVEHYDLFVETHYRDVLDKQWKEAGNLTRWSPR